MCELPLSLVMTGLLVSGTTVAIAVEPTAEPNDQAVAFGVVPVPDAFDPYSIVSVCPIDGSWGVFWHTPSGVDEQKASRARNQLQLSKFSECLELFVRTDPATIQAIEHGIRRVDVSGETPTIDVEAAVASNEAVQKRWSEFGVGEAIIEAAEMNARGERVARVMAACERLAAAEKAKAK